MMTRLNAFVAGLNLVGREDQQSGSAMTGTPNLQMESGLRLGGIKKRCTACAVLVRWRAGRFLRAWLGISQSALPVY
jgi:hypothetical protein